MGNSKILFCWSMQLINQRRIMTLTILSFDFRRAFLKNKIESTKQTIKDSKNSNPNPKQQIAIKNTNEP